MERRKSYLNQKGFSLVELIIVIAIMAILVAIMVPVLIKWIEKSNVSSDTQLADTVRGAFLCAVTDARVLADPKSDEFIEQLEDPAGMYINGNGKKGTAFAVSDSVMKESVEEILGMPVNSVVGHLKSKTSSNPNFLIKLANGNVIVEIEGTDSTGKGNPGTHNIVVD